MEINKGLAESIIDLITDHPDWMEKGACIDKDFDPLSESDSEDALAACKECTVKSECSEKFDSVNSQREIDYGIFGGKNYFK